MICGNCKKEIKELSTASYSKMMNEAFCSLDCFTNIAFEYLSCVSIHENGGK